MPHRHIVNKANVSNEPECQGHIFSMTEYLAGLYLDSHSIGVVCVLFNVPNRKMAPGRPRNNLEGWSLRGTLFMHKDLGIDLKAPCPEWTFFPFSFFLNHGVRLNTFRCSWFCYMSRALNTATQMSQPTRDTLLWFYSRGTLLKEAEYDRKSK